ncbi:MAG: malonyl-CoA decarboxylase domain-containing protein [Candidatus Fonsibacter sp.]
MLSLKRFLSFVADKGKKIFSSLLIKKKENINHTIDLCDQLLGEDGVVSAITIAREFWINYERLILEEKENFFLDINKKYRPNYSVINEIAKKFSTNPNEKNREILSEAVEGKRQELIRRLNMAPNGTQYLVHMREDLLFFLRKHEVLKSLDYDFRHLFRSWFNPGFLKLIRVQKNTDPDILDKIIKYERVHEIKNMESLYRRLENDRLFYAFLHPIVDKEPLIFVQVALTKGIGKSIQEITEGAVESLDDNDTATFYSISNSSEGLQGITLGNFLIKRVVFEIQQILPKIKNFYTLSPITGFADWFLKQDNQKLDKILNKNLNKLNFLRDNPEIVNLDISKIKENEKLIKDLVLHYLINEKTEKKPANGVANFHLNNGAIIFDIVVNGDLSQKGLKDSFGLMVNYFYDNDKILQNHLNFVKNGKISISEQLKSYVKN